MASNTKNNDAVIVIGGGFAGLTTALSLTQYQHRPPIILIEPQTKFVFLPLLFELLSGEVKIWEISHPYSSLLSAKGISLLQERVVSIDCDSQKVKTSSGLSLTYCQLVLSTGSGAQSLNIPGLKDYALMFQSLEDVKLIRKQIEEIKLSNKKQNNLVIVGGGPTGVELICKLADLVDKTTSLYLIEMGGATPP